MPRSCVVRLVLVERNGGMEYQDTSREALQSLSGVTGDVDRTICAALDAAGYSPSILTMQFTVMSRVLLLGQNRRSLCSRVSICLDEQSLMRHNPTRTPPPCSQSRGFRRAVSNDWAACPLFHPLNTKVHEPCWNS